MSVARQYIGAPSMRYRDGHPEIGQVPEEGFNCSGFVRFVLAKAGLHIPDFITARGEQWIDRHASEMFDHYGTLVHERARLPGDLIFFSRDGWRPTHVGIVGPDDIDQFIHAPGRDGTVVTVASIARTAIENSVSEHRQMYFENPIGYKSPTIALDEPSARWHQRAI